MTDDEQRLRRHLRALAATNRQLHEQVEALGGGRPAKDLRDDLTRLAGRGERDCILAQREDGAVFLVDGGLRRDVTWQLLAEALERHLGGRRELGADELDALEAGPPVQVLQSSHGAPFVVVGGERLPLRGLPTPLFVPARDVRDLGEGPTLSVGPDGGEQSAAARRTRRARRWLAELAAQPPDADGAIAPQLVAAPDGAVHLLDGGRRRRVAGRLLADALATRFGPWRPVTDDELDRRPEGPPVEVLEGPDGAAVVVAAGRRLRLRGYPAAHLVDAAGLDDFPEGDPLPLQTPNTGTGGGSLLDSGRHQVVELGSRLRSRLGR
ncbi:MAG: hypothetical protein MUF83_15215 [Acidimicrobiales bacterium]|nr:hypothetical protein [Acidimicrobiales bacterium]